MLVVMSVVALVKVGNGTAPATHLNPTGSWLNPFGVPSFNAFAGGVVLMVFIYWGWDTAVSVNEETKDKNKTPGQAAIISTVLLLVTYAVVIFSVLAFAGTGSSGIGLTNSSNSSEVLSVLGGAIFGGGGIGTFLSRLLILMVLSSAAASTQTTILPTARTTLSMAAYRALPKSFARMHPRYLTPTVSTIVMGLVSIAVFVAMNYTGHGNLVILDSVTAIGIYIAFYYGLTALSCVWYYRRTLTSSTRNLFMRGIIPALGWLIMWGAGGYALWEDWDVGTGNSYTSFKMPFFPHWHVGGAFLIAFLAAVAGVLVFIYMRVTAPAFFKKETLTRSTPTLVPDK
jgi:amino acid transporter